MSKTITPLIAGNWKMNGVSASLAELTALGQALTAGPAPRAIVVICPPATLLAAASAHGASSGILTGGQDCHPAKSGAHTGDISAAMLADAGAQYVIVGHSERRANHGETDELVRAKAEAGFAAGLKPIICVGETEAERDAGQAETVVERQLAGSIPDSEATFVVAYEPVWAIGTGRTPTNAEIAQMHARIRGVLTARFGERGASVNILYGGSLKPSNAREILAIEHVNGGLVGGASLLAKDFAAIISAV
ncbi:triose-phosphate isomerase [Devosia sp.]|uniref:triose-phosphate isomerase n=1 Tax=Devosia sp. TaxID=1871048 RepID=UPI0032675225